MAADRVLLDTTLQLWRIAYGPDETRKVHQELADKAEVYTTSFVFREFLNTIIADLHYVHTLTSENLQPDEDGLVGLERLSRFLGSGKGNYSTRSIQRLHLIIAMLLESFPRTRVPRSKILVRVERTAQRWLRDFFRYTDSQGSEQGIHCLTLLDEPGELEGLRNAGPFPGKPAFPRAVAGFLEAAKADVKLVESEMRKATKAQGRDDKLLKMLGRLKDGEGELDFAGRLREPKVWNWALGDLIIALETPEGVAVYSTDRSFRILTQALGKPRYKGYRTPS